MKSWLNLVNERNGLVRKTAELSLSYVETGTEEAAEKELSFLPSPSLPPLPPSLPSLPPLPPSPHSIKELELEDRQYDVDKELNDLGSATAKLTQQEMARFDELCELKIKIVEERNEIVIQTEEERQRYCHCVAD